MHHFGKDAASSAYTARNRENQRNFRARRQQYIQELEQKVRAFETLQIRATESMQNVSRIVWCENHILRTLLRDRLGLSNDIINQQITFATRTKPPLLKLKTDYEPRGMEAAQDYDACMCTQPSTRRMIPISRPSTQPLSFTDECLSTSPPGATDEKSRRPSAMETAACGSSSEKRCGLRTPPRTESTGTSVADAQDEAFMGQAAHQAQESLTMCTLESGPDRIGCEEATAIITGIRANFTIADVRQELGCIEQGSCLIQSANLFQVMNAWI